MAIILIVVMIAILLIVVTIAILLLLVVVVSKPRRPRAAPPSWRASLGPGPPCSNSSYSTNSNSSYSINSNSSYSTNSNSSYSTNSNSSYSINSNSYSINRRRLGQVHLGQPVGGEPGRVQEERGGQAEDPPELELQDVPRVVDGGVLLAIFYPPLK